MARIKVHNRNRGLNEARASMDLFGRETSRNSSLNPPGPLNPVGCALPQVSYSRDAKLADKYERGNAPTGSVGRDIV